MTQEVIYNGKSNEKKSVNEKNSQSDDENLSLPPVASGCGGRVNLWAKIDSNGDYYLELDMPGIRSVNFFLSDFLKPHFNHAVEKWRESRKEDSGGDRK